MKSRELDPYAITIGYLRDDRWLLFPLFCLLSISELFELSGHLDSETKMWSALVVDRVLQLGVATIVARRWRGRVSAAEGTSPRFLPALLKNLTIGIALWAAIMMPLVIMSRASDSLSFLIGAAATTTALVVSLHFFFYSSVAGLLGGSLQSILQRARMITHAHPSSAFKAFIGPFALAVLVVGLLSAPYPDGRSALWTALASLGENVFWLLSCYTAMAFTMTLLQDSDWRAGGLDPYRRERLETLELKGRGYTSRLLTPKTSAKILFLAGLVLLGNLAREFTIAPGPKISLKGVQVADKEVRVELELRDPVYHFRGFKPSGFTLASESGYPVATGILRVSTNAAADEIIRTLPESSGTQTLYITFSSERSKKDLEALENLWLWYQLKPLFAIPKEALIGERSVDSLPTPASDAAGLSTEILEAKPNIS
jgi:hypothetical protein